MSRHRTPWPLRFLATVFVSLWAAHGQASAALIFFTNPNVGGFLPNSATPEFLAAIGGTPDEFLSFAVDKTGAPLPAGVLTGTDQLGTIFSDNVVFSTKGVSPFVRHFADFPFFFPNSEIIGPSPEFDGVLNVDFLAAGQTARAVGFGTVELLTSESIRIYDQNDVLIATLTGVSDNIFSFFGVVATGPESIGRIELEGTFLAIQDFQYQLSVIPEPSGLHLLGVGALALICLRRRQSSRRK